MNDKRLAPGERGERNLEQNPVGWSFSEKERKPMALYKKQTFFSTQRYKPCINVHIDIFSKILYFNQLNYFQDI